MRLSVLDQSPIPAGASGGTALANSIDLARLSEQLGYHRYWVAEHHASPALAGAAPEVLLAAIGLAPTPWLLLVSAFAMGAVEPPLISSMFQIRARESPTHVQSQVFTTSASLRTAAFAASTAMCGVLISVGVGAVIAFGVALHLVALLIGLLAGPHLPQREHWVRRD